MRRRRFLQSFAALSGWTRWAEDFTPAHGFRESAEALTERTPEALLRPVGLKCEYTLEPLGVDVVSPRLSWQLESRGRAQQQSAYQLLVAGSPENLAAERADLWDTGKVTTDRSMQIDYQGRALASFERCYWMVRVWDQSGHASPYSELAAWEMGLLDERDWQAKWITADYLWPATPPTQTAAQERSRMLHRAPLLRKDFRLRAHPRRARAYICGLGYFELYLNGTKVGDHVLDPAQTDYEERALYVTHDITDYLRPGENAVGVMLGSGWFNQDEVWKAGKYSIPGGTDYGVPRLVLQMRCEYPDGTTERFISDESWRATPGPILADNVYAGESYDARLETSGWSEPAFDDKAWEKARPIPGPAWRLESQGLPPIKAVRTLPPKGISQPSPGVFVYDFGQNFAGWARLRVTAPGGAKITLRYAESLAPDGMIDPASTGVFATGVVQTDTYIARGESEEVWEPRFTYHGFRYVEMAGFPGTPSRENLRGVVVHSDVQKVGDFECSDAMLNRIHETALWTEVSNLHGIPTDCPGREKCGWLGDAHVSTEMAIYNFDMAQFWSNFLNDIRTSEQNGLPTMVAPGKRKLGDASPDWGTAVVQIPWYVYLYYGDTRILRQHYARMRRWLEHLRGLARDDVVSAGLGDWCPPGSVEPRETPVALTSTAYFYLDTQILSKVARILGEPADAADYRALAGKIRQAFNQRFLQTNELSYGSQTADSLALRLGLVPADARAQVASSLRQDVITRHGGHFSTGITGSRCLYWALAEYGYGEVALEILRARTYPSIGYLFSLGATTFWETWGEPELDRQHGPRSRNHAMQGAFDAWFYEGLAGIYPDPDEPGFRHTILRPQVVQGLDHVRAAYDSIQGRIVSAWRFENQRFEWHVLVPANTRATLHLPCDDSRAVTEGGRPVQEVREVLWRGWKSGRAILEIGSGEYDFASSLIGKWQAEGSAEVPRPWW